MFASIFAAMDALCLARSILRRINALFNALFLIAHAVLGIARANSMRLSASSDNHLRYKHNKFECTVMHSRSAVIGCNFAAWHAMQHEIVNLILLLINTKVLADLMVIESICGCNMCS
jgi:hypothetical protein